MPSRRQTPTPRAATSMTVLALLLLAAVAACGQKGPLYLPERTPMVIGEDTDDDEEESRPPAAAAATRPDTSEAAESGHAEDEEDVTPRSAAPEPGP